MIQQDDWNDTVLHSVKRGLSIAEKLSLTDQQRSGLCLVMPAVSGTEIEELAAVGVPLHNIFAVEQNQELADRLYGYYWDTVSIHWEEIGVWLTRAKNFYSYMHIDYCSQLGPKQCAGITSACKRLADHARLRVSVTISRRSEKQFLEERMIIQRVLLNMIGIIDRKHFVSDTLRAVARHIDDATDDATIAMAAVMFAGIYFNMSWEQFSDYCLSHPDSLPEFSNRVIRKVSRGVYNEDHNGIVMATTWIDTVQRDTGLMDPFMNIVYAFETFLDSPRRYSNLDFIQES